MMKVIRLSIAILSLMLLTACEELVEDLTSEDGNQTALDGHSSINDNQPTGNDDQGSDDNNQTPDNGDQVSGIVNQVPDSNNQETEDDKQASGNVDRDSDNDGQIPSQDNQNPKDDNQAPDNGNQTPADDSQDSENDSQPPADDTQDSGSDSQPPADEGQDSGSDSQPPAGDTQDPGSDSQPPADDSQDPGSDSQPPADDTQNPGSDSQPPADDTQDPGSDSQPPDSNDVAVSLDDPGILNQALFDTYNLKAKTSFDEVVIDMINEQYSRYQNGVEGMGGAYARRAFSQYDMGYTLLTLWQRYSQIDPQNGLNPDDLLEAAYKHIEMYLYENRLLGYRDSQILYIHTKGVAKIRELDGLMPDLNIPTESIPTDIDIQGFLNGSFSRIDEFFNYNPWFNINRAASYKLMHVNSANKFGLMNHPDLDDFLKTLLIDHDLNVFQSYMQSVDGSTVTHLYTRPSGQVDSFSGEYIVMKPWMAAQLTEQAWIYYDHHKNNNSDDQDVNAIPASIIEFWTYLFEQAVYLDYARELLTTDIDSYGFAYKDRNTPEEGDEFMNDPFLNGHIIYTTYRIAKYYADQGDQVEGNKWLRRADSLFRGMVNSVDRRIYTYKQFSQMFGAYHDSMTIREQLLP
ncbi:MAG: hypothetical protein ABW092_08500 [Candidatus Thiodiazotropha sp.]